MVASIALAISRLNFQHIPPEYMAYDAPDLGAVHAERHPESAK